jgi:Na+/H+-translocating membrane pyrophosphatase
VHPFIFPFLTGTVAALAARRYADYSILKSIGNDALSAALSFGGSIAAISTTMLGFMLAALAVLASINHTHLVKMMKASGHYKDLLRTLFVSCLIFLACAAAGFSMLFGFPPSHIFLSALVGLHFAAVVSIVDVGRKFWLVLNNLNA